MGRLTLQSVQSSTLPTTGRGWEDGRGPRRLSPGADRHHRFFSPDKGWQRKLREASRR